VTAPPIEWVGDEGGVLRVLDQTLLPNEERRIDLSDVDAAIDAIRRLVVRGAPMIGVAGAYGVHLAVRSDPARDAAAFSSALDAAVSKVGSARPTAVNLKWAVDRVREAAASFRDVASMKRAVFDEAARILDEDRRACDAMASYGVALFRKKERVLTYCNSGALATAGVGTALGVVLEAAKKGLVERAYACETRPLLQGARLTMWELMRSGVDATLLCDNAVAELMRRGGVDRVLVGADRIAANGDAANKIGTFGVALAAAAHGVPFHVVAPLSTIDLETKTGADIPIEERGDDEVLAFRGARAAPEGAKAFCPAFDVTPAKLVASLVTDAGVVERPDEAKVRALFSKARA
jgi:methylthioribose-1-phosphate isomerase